MPTNAKQTIYKDQDCRIQLDFKSNAKLGNYIQVKQAKASRVVALDITFMPMERI
ncbi:hypothetical protein A1S_3894 [Acinetobacter baumannii ATCC 17978]|nr:hypothetical protein A1S_3894 [Acinetobacter baumannii ATCC 17978]